MREPSQEYLHECFDYVDGKLYWKERPRHHFKTYRGFVLVNLHKSGNEAGYKNKFGYIKVGIDGKIYNIARLIYIYFNGSISDDSVIDHIDGIRHNNKINNLRLVDEKTNQWNKSKLSSNTSGVTGVYYHKNIKSWVARGTVNSKHVTLYCGKDFFEAVCARKSWESKHKLITKRHGK